MGHEGGRRGYGQAYFQALLRVAGSESVAEYVGQEAVQCEYLQPPSVPREAKGLAELLLFSFFELLNFYLEWMWLGNIPLTI